MEIHAKNTELSVEEINSIETCEDFDLSECSFHRAEMNQMIEEFKRRYDEYKKLG